MQKGYRTLNPSQTCTWKVLVALEQWYSASLFDLHMVSPCSSLESKRFPQFTPTSDPCAPIQGLGPKHQRVKPVSPLLIKEAGISR